MGVTLRKSIKVGDLVQHHVGFGETAKWVTLGLVVDIPETDWVEHACILTRDSRIIKRALDNLEIANEKEQKERNKENEKLWAWKRKR